MALLVVPLYIFCKFYKHLFSDVKIMDIIVLFCLVHL